MVIPGVWIRVMISIDTDAINLSHNLSHNFSQVVCYEFASESLLIYSECINIIMKGMKILKEKNVPSCPS